MPSPFPGMDPFLEHPDRFPGFHDRLVINLDAVTQPQLPEPYMSDIGRRAWIEISERYVQPDVEVMRPRDVGPSPNAGSTTTLLERTASEPIVVHVPHDERREPFLEIFIGRGRDRRLVTVVEVLSRSNKTAGEEGRNLYLRKQREVLAAKVNLVEIDLLRSGQHTTAVPEHRLRRQAPQFDYHVCIHRFDNLEDYFVHAIRMQEPLPTIRLPLLPEDGSVPIDLQAVFNRCYDAGPYKRDINYLHDEPEPPLTEDQTEWMNRILKRSTT